MVGITESLLPDSTSPKYSQCIRSFAKTLDIIWDIITAVISITDVVTDLLVANEFYQDGKMTEFTIAVAIFILAQLSYAFLFAGTWAKEFTNCGKFCVFLLALPLGQFVPIFAWLESFHFEWLDNFIRKMSLKPTDKVGTDGDDDTLWAYIQAKYQAHAGFLAEAFMEAVPQSILQVAAIMLYGKASNLNLLSILLSIIVIASKGYIVSYSIHRPTFLFNFICIIADCFGLFATFTWLFVNNASLFNSSWWQYLALGGALLSVLGGFALVWFTIFDDHLKSRKGMNDLDIDDPCFSLYIIRLFAWVLGIVPCSVVYCTARLTFIPIVLFRSLDPEHALHSSFYRRLFNYCLQSGTDLRLQVANTYFEQARKEKFNLKKISGSITRWVERVGKPKTSGQANRYKAKKEKS